MSQQCKSCGAEIEFVKMESGKFNPVNAAPRFTIVTDDGRVETGRISHFANCPAAGSFRKKEQKA